MSGCIHLRQQPRSSDCRVPTLTGVLTTSSDEHQEWIMNTYDPADYITYVAMDQQHRPSVGGPGPGDVIENHLPEGYANASPMTRLRVRAAVRASQPDGRPPFERLQPRIGPGEPMWSRRADGTA
jgi:hypothetical protein